MTFIEQVRHHLRQVAAAPEGMVLQPAGELSIDAAAMWQLLVGMLERLEARDSSPEGHARLAELHSEWATGDRTTLFGTILARRLRDGFAHGASAEEIQRLVRIGLARRLGLDDSTGSVIRDMELDRLAKGSVFRDDDEGWSDPRQYAERLHLTRPRSGRHFVTPLGRVFADLDGRDAIRWLLHVEIEQSLGPRDPFRMARETVAHMAAAGKEEWRVLFIDDYGEFGISGRSELLSPSTIRRLEAMGLLDYSVVADDETITGYTLSPTGRDLLREIVGATDTPMRLLAHALIQDETQRALTEAQPALAAAVRASAAESVARQARMVAHELTNALTPVQVAVDGLFQLVDQEMPESPEANGYRRRIQAGLERAFRFVEQSLAPAALLAGGDELFDVGACLRDAIAEVNGEARGAVKLGPVPTLPAVMGSRSRFVLAVVNLIRNAAQATRDRSAVIELVAMLDGAHIVVRVDDNGPGVAPEHREAVFAAGFKLRPDGHGQGLSLVREVVETELHGTIRCETSPLGGARFLLRLPIARRGNP